MDEKHNHEENVSIDFDSTPIFYTDNVNITVNQDGVVLNFLQRLPHSNQVRIVARVGMSREHAKKFIDAMEASLKGAENVLQSEVKKAKLN